MDPTIHNLAALVLFLLLIGESVAWIRHDCWRLGCSECERSLRERREHQAQVDHDYWHTEPVEGCRRCERRKDD